MLVQGDAALEDDGDVGAAEPCAYDGLNGLDSGD